MIESGLRFLASDGKHIIYTKVLPATAPRAVVVVGHGMNDHGARFMSLADTLADNGLAVFVPDLRGHGSTDPGEGRGFLAENDGFERTVEDLVELGDFAAKEMGGLPLYYFGHSFGALLGMALAAMYGKYLEGVVLSAPPEKPSAFLDFAGELVVRLGIRFKGERAPAELPKAMTFGAYNKTVPEAKTGSDWISRDASAVAAYVADPQCAFTCTYGFYRDLMHGIRKVYAPGFLQSLPTNLPVYLFCGSADPVIGMRKGYEKLASDFRSLGLVDFESKCYEGGRHESLNEINKDEVLADIAEWFARHIA
ncbi:MAG TPA: alpha/beta hydrolase [Rectinemataceae bacterium]